ncbi:hypothetical protein niasHS_017864 [Heterodera schachtii]|uniref:Uncharacterized protein n=1 Tax=Heterodera schachtii TaxID=97005 RepID=A0ABD2I4X5_HETSC
MEGTLQIEKGDFLWLDNKNYGSVDVAIGARVLSVFCDNRTTSEEKRILLMDDEGKKVDVNIADLIRTFNARPMHRKSIQIVENVLQLDETHEASLMRNLYLRHSEGIYYTFIGPQILLALRPNGRKMAKTFVHYNALYSNHPSLHLNFFNELPPHIFSFGADLLQKMGTNNCFEDHQMPSRNCCVVFNGECGSGKSTNFRHLLNFVGENAASSIMKEQIKAAILLMDAFGNAKTASNLNGTRIVNWWQLHFSSQNGKAKLNSINIEQNFMEKGRILEAPIWAENQRNFHIFYSLIAGLNQKQKLEFGVTDQPRNFHFLDKNKNSNASALIDLREICDALRTILFKETEIDAILRILSALLHFGNLRFETICTENGEERIEIIDRKNIGRITKTLKALDARDCIVGECYAKLVAQIVTKANETIGAGRRKDLKPVTGSICLVDFPGIETNFDVPNNFEQLCINYSAECLQQFFVRRIFKIEQNEYEAQCLPGWSFGCVEFSDNWPILDILAVNSLSIMGQIDDASGTLNFSDDQLLEQLHNTQQTNGQQQQKQKQCFYVSPKSQLCAQFVVNHYTGQVTYEAKGMLATNRSHFPHQLRRMLIGSKLPFLQLLFELPTQNGDSERNIENDAHLKHKTLANCCRRKMDALVGRLGRSAAADAYFVRCIRPNESPAEENHFDRSVVLRQIRQMDLLAVVEQCRAGFTASFEYSHFVSRYGILVPILPPVTLQKGHCVQETHAICQRIFEANGKSVAPPVAFGKTKIFLKSEAHFLMEHLRKERLRHCAVLAQKILRGWAKLRQFARLRWAAVVFQKNWRTFTQQKNYQKRTMEERQNAMILRFEKGKKLADEPPALFLHSAELDAGKECVKNLSGGIYVQFVGQEETLTHGKRWDGAAEVANFGWRKFVLAYFRNNLELHQQNCRHPIGRPLLAQNCELDQICAVSIWGRVQQLMGNAFEGEKKIGLKNKGRRPIMLRLSEMFVKNWTNSALEKLRRAITHNPCSIEKDENSSPNSQENILISCSGESALDKIQVIVGIGILRAKLRDEIFCQICSQIEHNSSERSKARGWALLALCSASFSPSSQLFPYFLNFVHHFATKQQIFCRIERSLMRIRRFGVRKEPPVEVELFCSIFDDAQMFVPIHLTDGRLISLPIVHAFGFGLFLSVGRRFIRSLGVGSECVIDAIASLETKSEKNWRIFFRKELFRAHQSESDDPLAIELAFRQILGGIHSREYQYEKEDDLVTLAAQQHFIDINGQDEFDAKLMEEKLDEVLPIGTLNGEEENEDERDEEMVEIERQRWVQLIMHTFRRKIGAKDGIVPTVDSVKCQVIEFARAHWPAIFSRFFHLTKFSGPPLPSNQISLAVNSNGLALFDPTRQNKMAEFTFAQISAVTHSNSKSAAGAQSVSLQLLNGDRFIFQSPRSAELALLINQMLQHLCQKSLYAIALQNSCPENAFEYSKGDLFILNVPFGEQNNNDQITVENAHSGMHGAVALSAVHILTISEMPTTEELRTFLSRKRPENEEMFLSAEPTSNGIVPFQSAMTALYDQHSSAAFWAFQFDFGQMIRHPAHNLEKFAANNFRRAEAINGYAGRSEDSSIYSFSSSSVDDHFDLWRHSKKPLKAPLLRRLNGVGRDEIVQQSICSFSHILMYMCDQPMIQQHFQNCHSQLFLLTDAIFEAPLKHEILRDEIYCQLMKQLTLNPNPMSEERGWELMWLCLGLFAPSSGLLPDLALFLRSRPFPPLAVDCAERLEKIIKNSPPFSFRQFPPHQVEVEAIQKRQTQIFHKIHLPNGSHVNVEVESWSVAKELSENIAQTIGLRSATGLFLFVKIGEKVVCIPPDDHFFDFIHKLQRWARKSWAKQNGGAAEQAVQFAYKVHFMRKVWLDVVPGQDMRQDLLFHYYQELPKYLRGYHNIGKREAAQIGALILRAQTKDGKEPPLAHIQHILQQLIPRDFLKMQNSAEWKRLICAEFGANLQMPKCSDDAKMAFLRRLSSEPTFGSAFFEAFIHFFPKIIFNFLVKQSADSKMGSKLLVAINRDGISLYGSESKQHICTYGFEQICQWQPANTYFHITMEKGNRLLFETTLGHKMDDLLTSYIQAMIARRECITTKCQNERNAKSGNVLPYVPLLAFGDDRREFA